MDTCHQLEVCVLASGSKGNCVFVSDGTTRILMDAGMSGVRIQRQLASRGIDPRDLDAILVTHEHWDHISAVGILSRRFGLPVYISEATRNSAPQLGRMTEERLFRVGRSFTLGELRIHPFSTSHDAADPAGFTISANGKKVALATDLGVATHLVKQHLANADLLILEANHDVDMLDNGPYPWHLKQRIKSRSGHLSNPDSRVLLAQLLHDNLQHVILAHLSETNNTPEKALAEVGLCLNGCKTTLTAALQDTATRRIIIK